MELRRILRIRTFFALATALQLIATAFSVLILLNSTPTSAAQTIPYKINFQGRLTDNNGNILTDGWYNVKFRIYDDPTLGGAHMKFEEDRLYAGSTLGPQPGAFDNRVHVVSGLFNIQFGDVTTGGVPLSLFTSTYPLYLEVELPTPATATCDNGSISCSPAFTEGAMTPRQALASTPYAYNSQTLDGLDSSSFGQLTAIQSWTATNTFSNAGGAAIVLSGTAAASGSILQIGSALSSGNAAGTLFGANTTSTGDLINLQVSSSLKLKVDNSGTITDAGNIGFTQGGNHTLTVAQAASGAGNNLSVNAGQSATNANNGGNLYLQAGASATGGAGTSGSVIIEANGVDTSTAFQIQNAAAAPAFTVDSVNNKVVIGDATGTNTGTTLLVVDTSTVDPATGYNGAEYYNSTSGLFRCYQAGAWTDCITPTVTATANSQNSYISGRQANLVANTAGQVTDMNFDSTATAFGSAAAPIAAFAAPAAGSFRSCFVKDSTAVTAGTVALRWRVNGVSVGSAACTLSTTAGATRQAVSTLDSGVTTFNAGDTIAVALDTSAGFTPLANIYTIYWTVEYNASTGNGLTMQFIYNNSSSPATIALTDSKNLVVNAPDTATDPSDIINLQCTTCSVNGGRFAVQNGGVDAFTVSPNNGGIALNQTSTISAGKNLVLASGTGSFQQSFTNNIASSAQTDSISNTNTTGSVAIQGVDLTPGNNGATSGTNTVNLLQFEAGTTAGTNVTNGLNFASSSGYTNFISSPNIKINSSGDDTTSFTSLGQTSTANGAGAASTSLILTSATGFATGNYIQMNSANCGGAGVNPCYAKITGIATNTLTITPALTWANGSTVNEYHIPEIGGTDTAQPLANRYGRGYFIAGVATGNGTTYYNEDSVTSSLSTFNLLTSGVSTLNIGSVGTTLTLPGTLNVTGSITAPSTGTDGYISRSGTTLSPTNGGDNFTTSGNISTTGSGTISSASTLSAPTVNASTALQVGGANINTGGGSPTLSNVDYLDSSQTISGTKTFSASSAQGAIFSGSAASGGSQLQFGGVSALSSGSVNGTYIGSNPAAYTGDLLNFQINNVAKLKVDNSGNLNSAGTINGLSVSGNTITSATLATPTVTGSITGSSSPTITGFGTINGQTIGNAASFVTSATAPTINATITYQANGTNGVGVTCSGGQANLGAVYAEGILTTAGTCTTVQAAGNYLVQAPAGSANTITAASGAQALVLKGTNGTGVDLLDIYNTAATPLLTSKFDQNGAFTTTAPIVAPTTTNSINGLIINSGALSGITTIATSGAINGASLSGGSMSGGTLTTTAVNGLNVSATAISVVAAATNLTVDAGTSGTISIGGNSTGDILLAGGSGTTGCTVTNLNGNFGCSGNIDAGSGKLFTIGGTQIASTNLSDSASITKQGSSFNGNTQLVQTNASGQLPAISGTNLTNLNATNLAQGSGAVILQSANGTNLTLNLGTTGQLNVGTNATAKTIQIGQTTAAVTDVIGVGNSSFTGSIDTITIGNQLTTSTTAVQGGTGASAISLTPGAGGGILATTTGAGAIEFDTAASVVVQSTTNSTTTFQVQNAIGSSILNVDTTDVNLVTNSGFEANPMTNWSNLGSGSVVRVTSQHYLGFASGQVTTGASTGGGASNAVTLANSTQYTLSFYAKLDAASQALTTLQAGYSSTGLVGGQINCALNSTTVITAGWNRYVCTFTTIGSHSGTPYIYIQHNDTTSEVFYVDAVQIDNGSFATPYGSGQISLNANINSPVNFQESSNSTSAFQITNTLGTNILNVDTLNSNLSSQASNPSFEAGTTGWAAKTGCVLSQDSTTEYNGSSSGLCQNSATVDAGMNMTGIVPAMVNGTTYTLALYVKSSLNMTTLELGHSDTGLIANDTSCLTAQTVTSLGWKRLTCTFTAGAQSGTPYIYIRQTDGVARNIWVDAVTLETDANASTNYRDGRISLGNATISSPAVFQTNTNSSTAFQIQNAGGIQVFNVDTASDNNLVTNSGFEVNATGWSLKGSASNMIRDTSKSYVGIASGKVTTTTTAGDGMRYTFGTALPAVAASSYTISAYVETSLADATFNIGYNNGADTNCASISPVASATVPSTVGWTRFTCSTPINTAVNSIYVTSGTTSVTLNVDGVQVVLGATATAFGNSNITFNGVFTSPIAVRSPNDTTTEFQVQNAASSNLFTIDSLNKVVEIGSPIADTTQILLQLDSYGAAGSSIADTSNCGTTTNQGALYYNSNSSAIRGCVNGNWEDVVTTGGLGLLAFGVIPDSANAGTPGDIAGVSNYTNSPCKVTWTSSGANISTVTVNPCAAYSGGRKIIVPTTAINLTAVNLPVTDYANICLTGTGNQPALLAASGTETSAAVPAFSANNPVLCLATVRAAATAGVVSNIWDTRTFTNTQKEFATINSVSSNGYLVIGSGTAGVYATTNTGAATLLRGTVVATSGTASAATVNAIISVKGPTFVKFLSGGTATVNNLLQTTTTAGYATSTAFVAGNTTNYTFGGPLEMSISTSCASANTALTACQYSPLVDFAPTR